MSNQEDLKKDKIIFYTSEAGSASVEVLFKDETMWLTQKAIADLFMVDRTVITKHLNNVFSEGELNESSTWTKFAQVQNEGGRNVTRHINFYNLDAIIAVGYRVNSKKATQFRISANKTA